MRRITLRLTQTQHEALRKHLLPGDGLEAVAIGLCGRRRGDEVHVFTLRTIVPIPYEECKVRQPDRVTWSTDRLVPLLTEAQKRDLAVFKIHSHPGNYEKFSEVDDASDADVFGSVAVWTESDEPHCSTIMLGDGRIFGRAIFPDGSSRALDSVLVAGDDLLFWPSLLNGNIPEFAQRHSQLFGAGTTQRLRQLSIAVIGCSGTGSPLIEQLARLGVGRLILIDPDKIEEKNLNRIVNSTRDDANHSRYKVEVMARAIDAMGLGTVVVPLAENLISRKVVEAVAQCDVVFGCMDSVEGRHLLNRLAACYVIPYFDLGVKLQADGRGGIDEACAAVHYLRPDGSSLLDRRAYTLAQLKSEGLRRTDPAAYRDQVKAGYIHGVQEDRPAVVSINTHVASCAVNELLARLHPYRLDSNAESAVVRISFIQGVTYRESEPHPSGTFERVIGRGDSEPLLGMPELGRKERTE